MLFFLLFCQLSFLASFMISRAFTLNSLKEFKLVEEGSLLNLRSEAFHRRIAVLQSSLNQGMLCLFEGEVFGMVSFASEIRVSINCFVRFLLFGSCIHFWLKSVCNYSQFALFIFQWREPIIIVVYRGWRMKKNIYTSFYSFVRGRISVVCELDGGREVTQIAILTDNFFPWP